ncbi:uncharacterized protein [Nicotiana sylvestris]|uniref:uncharacterized protein isoform X2 n=1 Tax=Nicotiana sylvestris TaxID=4096 RepID=UPI00388C66E2
MTLERSILQYIEWKEDNGKVIFQTRAKVMSTIYTLRIDKAFNYNLISTYMVEKLNLPCVEHIDPYMLKGVKVDKRVLLPFSIGRYEDVIWCDVIPMNRFHILLGRPWNIYRSASYSIEKNRYSFEVNGKKLSLGPLTPSQICADEKIVKKNMEKYEREKNEKSKGVHVDIPREEKGEVVLSKKSGMSSEVNNDLEKKEKRESNKRNKVCKVEREKQERLSEGKELFSERKEAKGEENISLAIKAKESVSKKNVSLLPNPLTLSCFSSCDFVQPRDEIPFERSGEAQEMVAKDPIGFQHKFGNINSCWMVEDKSLIKFFVIKPFDYFDSYLQGYDMELPKSIAKVEPLHKRIQGQNSRTNFLQEEGNDSILGSSTLFKDMDEAFESQRWPLIRVQAKELQNKIIRLQVQMKKLLIGRKSSRIKDVNWLGDSIKDKDRVLEAPRPYTRSQAKELQTKVARLQWQIKKLSIVEEELKTKGNKLSKFYNYMVVQIEVQEEEDWVTKLALEVHQKGLKISLKEVQKGVFQKEPNWSPNQWPKLVVLRPKSAPKGLGRPHLILMTFLTL